MSSCDGNGLEFNNEWLVDSGVTSHMTGTWDMFLSVFELGPEQVVNGIHAVKGIGRV